MKEHHESLRHLTSTIALELEKNPRSKKLHPAMFERYLSVMVGNLEYIESLFQPADLDKANVSVLMQFNPYHLRFITRLVAVCMKPDVCFTFLLKFPPSTFSNASVACSWLESCTHLAKDSVNINWFVRSDLVLTIFQLLKSDNVYVSRCAAQTILQLTSTLRSLRTLTGKKEIINILKKLFQILISGQPTVMDHVLLESSRVVIQFLDESSTKGSPSEFSFSLSSNEIEIVLQHAKRNKLLQECFLTFLCYCSQMSIEDFPVADLRLLPHFTLCKLKHNVSLGISCESAWKIFFSSLEENIDTKYSLIACSVDFIKTRSFQPTPYITEHAFACCSKYVDSLYQRDYSDQLKLVLQEFICACLESESINFSLSEKLEIAGGIYNCLFRSIVPSDKLFSDRFLAELLKCSTTVTLILLESYPESLQVQEGFCRLIHLCNFVESRGPLDKTFSSSSISASVGAIELLTKHIFNAKSDALHDEVSEWVNSCMKNLQHFLKYSSNYEDVVNSYCHSTRLLVITKLLSKEMIDPKIILDFQVIEHCSKFFFIMFPALRRAIFMFLFACYHFPVFKSQATEILKRFCATSFEESDHCISFILQSWNETCLNSCDNISSCKAITGAFEYFKTQSVAKGGLEEACSFSTALRISKDLLTFLHSLDNLPCCFIGANEDDQDGLDCEES